jgi:transposase
MMNLMPKSTEVSAKATRRRFSMSEKIRILREADGCKEKGSVNALMRREGIYSSHLSSWRRQRDAGQFGKSPRKSGPSPSLPDPRDKQIAELEGQLRRSEAARDRAERFVALQKKVSELFGLELPTPSELESSGSETKR